MVAGVTKREKLLKRIRHNPRNVSFQDMRTLLEAFGFVLDRTRGSHHSFVGWVGEQKVLLVIPYKHPLKEVYAKKALALIDAIEAENE